MASPIAKPGSGSTIDTAIHEFAKAGSNMQSKAFDDFYTATHPASGTPDAATVADAAGKLTVGLALSARVLGASKEAADNYKEAVRNSQ